MTIKFEKLFFLLLLVCALQSCDNDSLEDVNGAPIAHGDTFSVKEDVDEQAIIGTIEASDPDDDKLIFEIRSGGNDLFEISSEGEISLAPGKYLDYETVKEHSLVVMVSDGIIDRFRGVMVKVEDVEEPIEDNSTPFIITWKTNMGNQTLHIGANTDYSYDFTIDWGDGTIEEIVEIAPEAFEHTYEIAGTYTVSIKGEFPSFSFEEDYSYVKSIDQWGDVVWKDLSFAFALCANMQYNASDVPDLSNVTSLEGLFYGAGFFNADLGDWDTSNITNMERTFSGSKSFNGDISSWDTSNVTNMSEMFAGTDVFNADIGNWDTSNVLDMSGMFFGAYTFNIDIGNWNTSNVTDMTNMFRTANSFNGNINDWKTSSVTTMSGMFAHATSFNGDLSEWNTTNVANMQMMFKGATSFDQDLGGWDIGSLTMLEDMFIGSGISAVNLSNTFIGWSSYADQNDGPSNITVGLDNLSICLGDGINALQNLFDNYQWDYTGNLNLVQCN